MRFPSLPPFPSFVERAARFSLLSPSANRSRWHAFRPSWRRASTWRSAAGAVALAALALVGALYTLPSRATPTAGASQSPPGHRSRVGGVLPPALAHAKRTGQQKASAQLHLSLGLRLAHAQDLQATLTNLEDRKSAQYHKYLTPQAFADKYGPSPASLQAVLDFLRAAGMQVTGVSSNRALIDVTSTVAQAQQAFDITISTYQLGNQTFYAPDREPTVPPNLAPLILNIGGLDSLLRLTPHIAVPSNSQAGAGGSSRSGAHPRLSSPIPGAYSPTDLQGAYDASQLIANSSGGSGDVGVFELAPYIPGDVAAYRSQYALPTATITAHSVDSAAVTCAAAGTTCDVPGVNEADLDLEVVAALAPRATLDVFVGPNSPQGLNDTYYQMVNNTAFHVITTSWGMCEALAGQAELNQLHAFFLQAQSQGQTIFAAAGDSGSDDCGYGGDAGVNMPPTVDSPASDPLVLGVGGTSLTVTNAGGSSPTYGSETAWNGTCGTGAGGSVPCGGGGGLSSYFSRPAWQLGGGVANAYTTGQREAPDVAADADPHTGYSIYCSSAASCRSAGWMVLGGTSAAAPLWAALFNDVDGYKQAQPSGSPVGWGNQILYDAFANSQTYAPFHDVTSGTNDLDYTSPPFQGDYPATACYDQASGMGSPDAWNLARDVAAGVQTGGGGPCPATAVSTTNLIADGSFENTTSGWQQFSFGHQQLVTVLNPHTGTHALFLCGYPGCDDRAWQTVSVPATVHSATLSFWVDGLTSLVYASPAPPCLDHFSVTLATPDGTVFTTVQASCNLYANLGYALISAPVTSALKGHLGLPMVVMFRATTANVAPFPDYYSQWSLDDVALTVS